MPLRFLVVLIVFALSISAEAQQQKKVPRIGFLSGGSPSSWKENVEGFRQGLRQLGYLEGKNIVIEYRFGEVKLDLLPELAAELARLKVDVIVTTGTPATLAAKQASTTIPIVMVGPGDPVRSGLVASLARPGGNITGLSALSPELAGKRLEILQEAFPKISRVALLLNPNNPANAFTVKETEVAAKAMGLQLRSFQFRNLSDLGQAFSTITGRNTDALVLLRGPFSVTRTQIVDLAAKTRLPAIYPEPEYAAAGGVMAYGTTNADLYSRAAIYVDKILKGAKHADLPVEQPTKFELVINLKTANTHGLTIPQSVLHRADRVIKEASAKAGGR